MGYNATYGLPLNDSMSRFDVGKGDGQLNFLETDINGNNFVKQEFAGCAVCGESLAGQIAYVHGNEEICKKCEAKKRLEIRKKKLTNKTTKKAVKK